ncbi:PREDICTED: cytochrome P450 9e2-like [Nicrophorus vespilloides]|uniref:Cytochrome P450 9e2-like n=1 Tax=Nicrophorus vespilloides TaxID=110193 RepID=A0ABM1MS72_NICVS|nr:PREDICTED: cytochrome P450 9e2-like [Nicrophorus vespilloides]
MNIVNSLFIFLFICLHSVVCYIFLRKFTSRRYTHKWSKYLKFLLGNQRLKTFKNVPMNDIIQIYKEFPKTKINCFYNILQPTILVRDAALISKIVQTQSDYYEELFHPSDLNAKGVQSSNHSFFLRHLPAHFPHIKKCVTHVLEYLEDCGSTDLDTKQLFSNFTSDVLIYSIMGRRFNSFNYVFTPYFLLVSEMPRYEDIGCLRYFFSKTFPRLYKFLGLTKKNDMVLESVRKFVEARKYEKKMDNNYIHFLIDSQKESGTKIDLARHVLNLYMNSFEICTNLMSFMAYELAMNPRVQQFLYDEIETVMLQSDGAPGCEEIMMMEYLHMVVSETLRKWPVVPAATTVCTKNMILDNSVFWKGEHIVIPIVGLHRDPKHFPNPTEFDPERFLEDKKDGIKPDTFHPFGLGLKNRLGSSLAFIQIKILFVYLLSKFEFLPVPCNISDEYITNKKTFSLGLQHRNKIKSNDQVQV